MILEGKTVLVAGVGAGLGRHVVEAALRDGANVLLAARTEAVLEQTAKEVDPSGKRVAWRRTDIGDAGDCQALVAHGEQRFGKVDALVQVAAYEFAFGGLHDADLDNWRKCFETNVLGTMTLLRAVHPAMKRAGGGSIVLIGSQSMFLPSLPQAGYAASKGALLTAMYYLAQELGADNVRVNMVVPSWMWGPPVEGFLSARAKNEKRPLEEIVGEITGKFALRRMTEDGEVAEAAIFFCSDRAKAITGQHLLVNTGELMR
ncbi:MAG TPA: SDR family oxidoreductase [Myxococcota bacterium]|nr:SDR family oxidoreductase [Myxococcota bacterium]